MHLSARAEAEDKTPEWRQGQDAELAGAKILACPYPEGAQARRWRSLAQVAADVARRWNNVHQPQGPWEHGPGAPL